MAKFTAKDIQKEIDRKIKEGRGLGDGMDYKPWIFVNEIPSKGRSHIQYGYLTGRDHHLLSDGENRFFHVAECSTYRRSKDIREQYPLLPIDETLEIASQLGIDHPAVPAHSSNYTVMTTDFLITTTDGMLTTFFPRTVKRRNDLFDVRKVEKLTIEAVYWQRRNLDWGIVVVEDIPEILFRNLKLLRPSFNLNERMHEEDLYDITTYLSSYINTNDLPLSHVARECDRSLGFETGTSLPVAYHLILRNVWVVDLYSPIVPGKPLVVKRINQFPTEK